MAEQRTNIDIEDVLSSIRRLVSEEPVRLRRPDLLLLTPAHRVADDAPAPPRGVRRIEGKAAALRSAPDPQPVPAAGADTAAGDVVPVLPIRDTLRAAAVHLADFADPPAPAPQPGAAATEDVSRHSDLRVTVFGESDTPAIPGDALPDEAEIAAFFRRPAREELSLEERIADLEAAISHTDEEFEPDGSEAEERLDPHVVRRADPGPESWQRLSSLGAEDVVGGADPATSENARSAPVEDYAGADFITPGYEPQAGAGPASAAADAVYTLRRPGTQSHAPDTAAIGEEYTEALIDEDSLRDIVAELVREELRGELGERITRNVRSMIRRELNRALTLRDLSEHG